MEYYRFLYATGFRFFQIQMKSLIVDVSIAFERGVWTAGANGKISSAYLSQWWLIDGEWVMENEMTNVEIETDQWFD